MKKIAKAGILSLIFVLTFIFTSAFAEVAAAGYFQIQPRHDYNIEDFPIIHINKHDLTLKKGESFILKAIVLPGGKSVSVDWRSSNPKIAKVSASGKVTAVAQGTAKIYADDNTGKYDFFKDNTGYSDICYVTVPGGVNDAKPLNASDLAYSYGKTKFTVPTGSYYEPLAKIKKSIGGFVDNDIGYVEFAADHDIDYEQGLLYGSKDPSKAHTIIYFNSIDRGYFARDNSPIQTNRGIAIGTKKSIILEKYGLPTRTYQFTEAGKTYEYLGYSVKEPGRSSYTITDFFVLKSKGTVSMILFMITNNY